MTISVHNPALGHDERRPRRVRSPAAKLAGRSRAEQRQVERVLSRLAEAGMDWAPLLAMPGARLQPLVKSFIDWLDAAKAGAAPVREADAAAFSAGPRARAILRGLDLAEKSLADSGGSYSLAEVRRLLNGVSRQSVEKRVREGRLLAVAGRNNKRFYPVAQFNDDGSVVEGLSAVQDALATQNGYAVLNFLVNPDPRLDGRKPIDLLKRGEIEPVLAAAARMGEQGG